MLYNAAQKVIDRYDDAKDFFNSGWPISYDDFFNTYLVDGFINSKVRAESVSAARKEWEKTGATFPKGEKFIKV